MTSSTQDKGQSLLDRINSPADLRQLEVDQLPQLCQEIREFLIANLSVNPGHFASSMGAVDLIVALHYVFSTPDDRIVWDVGHQAYAHKILTGRRDSFSTLRKSQGLSGFPNPLESPYDTFMAGHAGNSISAALGMAIADKSTPGRENRKTVAVIGDASISGGLAFEGLNNASNHPNDLLIVLNDNDMSIDNNVGALHSYLSDMTTSAGYNWLRNRMAGFFRRRGILTDARKRAIIRFNNSVKSLISSKQNIFEGLNIRYFGPMNGHDVVKLVKVLTDIKDMDGPRLLHVSTLKGKGYRPAELNPTVWHAPGKFDPETGRRAADDCEAPKLWQEVFGETLVDIATDHPSVVSVTAAMPSGTSVGMMQKVFPDRTFDVGISEGHAVTFAGGLAAAGKKPFVAIYSSFLQRAYDNILHDVAMQGLPVTFCIDRAGIVGEDGVTHHGLFDIAYLRCVPGMDVASPADAPTLRGLMHLAVDHKSPLAIRYPRGKAIDAENTRKVDVIPGQGRRIVTADGSRIAVLTLGPVLENALAASKILEKEGIEVDVIDMIWAKPLDTKLLAEVASKCDTIVTVEDGALAGGFGSAVGEWLMSNGLKNRLINLGVSDKWVAHGSVEELHRICGFDTDGIVKTVRGEIRKPTES